jgi:hypothetical protein
MKMRFLLDPIFMPRGAPKAHAAYPKTELPREKRGAVVLQRSACYSLVMMNSGFMWKLL